MKLKFMISMLFFALSMYGQQADKDWYHQDAATGANGTSAKKAFGELLKDKKGRTIVVAVIDSGIDIEHEDLKDNIWTNPGEIPGNNIDDDKNGYVDDIHGWNFIGGPGGKNVGPETYEVTRLYAATKYKFDKADPNKLSKAQKKEYEMYLKYKEEVEKNLESAKSEIDEVATFQTAVLKGLTRIAELTAGKDGVMDALMKGGADLGLPEEAEVKQAAGVSKGVLSQFPELKSIDQLKEKLIELLDEEKKGAQNKIEFAYNTNYDSRKLIVKDNYSNSNEKIYGNNDVEGPDALHGTHVGGIIGAVVGNGIGNDGIAQNVKLMSVRAVPDGDERDKDVANAIRYAVDNGASVINMSFGKGYSWDKKVVNDAVLYALKKDVLLVHAAGNSGQNNDNTDNFPNDFLGKKGFLFKKPKYAKNWIEVGALSPKPKEDMVAGFSNYGKKNVDIFSPGVQIYATVPNNEYRYLQGTSMASPVVAGVAAVLRSYYPGLTAEQIKEVIMKSAKPIDEIVKKPGTRGAEKVKFSELSVTGGTVNLFNALKMAETVKGKKAVKSERA